MVESSWAVCDITEFQWAGGLTATEIDIILFECDSWFRDSCENDRYVQIIEDTHEIYKGWRTCSLNVAN